MKKNSTSKNYLQWTFIGMLAIIVAALTVNALDMQNTVKELQSEVASLSKQVVPSVAQTMPK